MENGNETSCASHLKVTRNTKKATTKKPRSIYSILLTLIAEDDGWKKKSKLSSLQMKKAFAAHQRNPADWAQLDSSSKSTNISVNACI